MNLKAYTNQIELLKRIGYEIVAIAIMHGENAYFFKNEAIAIKAHQHFEGNGDNSISGYWYGIEELEKVEDEYYMETKKELKIIFVDKSFKKSTSITSKDFTK